MSIFLSYFTLQKYLAALEKHCKYYLTVFFFSVANPCSAVQCMLELYSIELVSTIGSFYIAAIKGEVLGCGNAILDVHSSLLIALCQFVELNLRECDDTREVINALFR